MSGVERIAVERHRQQTELGWTPAHDDGHDGHELAYAAACYAAPENIYLPKLNGDRLVEAWPWEAEADKRGTSVARSWFPEPLAAGLRVRPAMREERIRELAKAGALVAAEIDRLERLGGVS